MNHSPHIFILGLNHKSAHIEIREKYSLSNSNWNIFCSRMRRDCVQEFCILSTCNRTEIYCVTENVSEAIEFIYQALEEVLKSSIEIDKQHFYLKQNEEALRHLFSVASGLDSMVVGETEILGQVKTAYMKAHEDGATGKVLNYLFQKTFQIAKKVRTETSIGEGRVSIASVATELSQKIFYKMENKTVLLIGSGQVARQVCESMAQKGVDSFIIANRNKERAEMLVSEFGGKAVPFDEIDQWAPLADIVISSAGTPKAFIKSERVDKWAHSKYRKSLFIIDLGVPRNVEEGVNDLSDVYLYNLDDLESVASKNASDRKRAAQEGMYYINAGIQNVMSRLNQGYMRQVDQSKGNHN